MPLPVLPLVQAMFSPDPLPLLQRLQQRHPHLDHQLDHRLDHQLDHQLDHHQLVDRRLDPAADAVDATGWWQPTEEELEKQRRSLAAQKGHATRRANKAAAEQQATRLAELQMLQAAREQQLRHAREALPAAVRAGDAEEACRLLAALPRHLSDTEALQAMGPAFCEAVSGGMVEVVRRMLQLKTRLPMLVGTPLHSAAMCPGPAAADVVSLLANYLYTHEAARLAARHDQHGSTPLHLAVQLGHAAAAAAIAAAAPQAVAARDRQGRTALHLAVEQGRWEAGRAILGAVPQAVAACDSRGRTALHLVAVLGGKAAPAVAYITKAAAAAKVVTRPDSCGRIALHLAAEKGSMDAAAAILAAGPGHLTVADRDGKTALHWAAARGHTAIVRAIVTQQPRAAGMADNKQRTPLVVALIFRQAEAAAVIARSMGAAATCQQLLRPAGAAGDAAERSTVAQAAANLLAATAEGWQQQQQQQQRSRVQAWVRHIVLTRHPASCYLNKPAAHLLFWMVSTDPALLSLVPGEMQKARQRVLSHALLKQQQRQCSATAALCLLRTPIPKDMVTDILMLSVKMS